LGRTHCKSVRNSMDRRLASLKHLLSLEKPTSMAIPYEAYPDGVPTIVWDSPEWKERYDQI
jgi:NADH:ubiquinone oxidoreductase subunit C